MKDATLQQLDSEVSANPDQTQHDDRDKYQWRIGLAFTDSEQKTAGLGNGASISAGDFSGCSSLFMLLTPIFVPVLVLYRRPKLHSQVLQVAPPPAAWLAVAEAWP